jgi:hypothetical protein
MPAVKTHSRCSYTSSESRIQGHNAIKYSTRVRRQVDRSALSLATDRKALLLVRVTAFLTLDDNQSRSPTDLASARAISSCSGCFCRAL